MPDITVFNRKNQPVIMRQLSEQLYEKLDVAGEPTGIIVNLPSALDCRSYFREPKKEQLKK